MLDKYKHTGKSDHEIFAWAVREAMAKACGYKTIEADVKDKVNYKKFMSGYVDSITMNGKTFTAEPMKSLFGKTKSAKREKKD